MRVSASVVVDGVVKVPVIPAVALLNVKAIESVSFVRVMFTVTFCEAPPGVRVALVGVRESEKLPPLLLLELELTEVVLPELLLLTEVVVLPELEELLLELELELLELELELLLELLELELLDLLLELVAVVVPPSPLLLLLPQPMAKAAVIPKRIPA